MGCGDGLFSLVLAAHCKTFIGYDISESLIEQAKMRVLGSNLENVTFQVLHYEKIAPLEKYDLVSCMGLTSTILDDLTFLRLLDRIKMLSKPGGIVLLNDTLSLAVEQVFRCDDGYAEKYRSVNDYRQLIIRRGFGILQEIAVSEIVEKKLVNKIFIFKNTNSFITHRMLLSRDS